MKKRITVLISIVLCIAMVLSFTSCDFIDEMKDAFLGKPSVAPGDWTGPSPVPEGYTGGFIENPQYHNDYGMYWLESYEEVLEALELLKAHGSIIKPSIGVGFNGEPFDVKWCFHYQRSCAEPLEEG